MFRYCTYVVNVKITVNAYLCCPVTCLKMYGTRWRCWQDNTVYSVGISFRAHRSIYYVKSGQIWCYHVPVLVTNMYIRQCHAAPYIYTARNIKKFSNWSFERMVIMIQKWFLLLLSRFMRIPYSVYNAICTPCWFIISTLTIQRCCK